MMEVTREGRNIENDDGDEDWRKRVREMINIKAWIEDGLTMQNN